MRVKIQQGIPVNIELECLTVDYVSSGALFPYHSEAVQIGPEKDCDDGECVWTIEGSSNALMLTAAATSLPEADPDGDEERDPTVFFKVTVYQNGQVCDPVGSSKNPKTISAQNDPRTSGDKIAAEPIFLIE